MKRDTLKQADPEGVIRLAKHLKLHIDGMSLRQVIALIVWRLHKNRQWGGVSVDSPLPRPVRKP